MGHRYCKRHYNSKNCRKCRIHEVPGECFKRFDVAKDLRLQPSRLVIIVEGNGQFLQPAYNQRPKVELHRIQRAAEDTYIERVHRDILKNDEEENDAYIPEVVQRIFGRVAYNIHHPGDNDRQNPDRRVLDGK